MRVVSEFREIRRPVWAKSEIFHFRGVAGGNWRFFGGKTSLPVAPPIAAVAPATPPIQLVKSKSSRAVSVAAGWQRGYHLRTMKSFDAPGGSIARWWERLGRTAYGRTLFSILVGRTAPYTSTIGARVQELRPGYARWSLRDRKRIRSMPSPWRTSPKSRAAPPCCSHSRLPSAVSSPISRSSISRRLAVP